MTLAVYIIRIKKEAGREAEEGKRGGKRGRREGEERGGRDGKGEGRERWGKEKGGEREEGRRGKGDMEGERRMKEGR